MSDQLTDPALTHRQRRFVEEYMIDLDAQAAALRAGYGAGSVKTYAYLLRRKPHVSRAIEAGLAEKAAQSAVTAERALARLGQIAFADQAGMFDQEGRLLPFDRIAPALRVALKVDVKWKPPCDGAPPEVAEYYVRARDSLVALSEINRRLGVTDWRRPGNRKPMAMAEAEVAAPGPLWTPLPGPQTIAYESAADITGYGGAAGGGKTDLALGLALTRHQRSAIFRREATQLSGIVDRLTEIRGARMGYNAATKVWRLGDGRQIEFGSAPHPGDERRYQGRPKDLLVLDEAAAFTEAQARFLMGWVRSADPAQRCRTVMTFNPPTSAEGRWVIDFFAPWLDPSHPNPAKDGELRWFATIDGKDVEVEDGAPFIPSTSSSPPVRAHSPMGPRFRGDDGGKLEVIHPTSRTFIASRLSDNPHLAQTGYMATLQAMPEPLRSQMLDGDFSAGVEDDRWQVIPTAWVDAAMARWAPGCIKAMDSIGVDVARGGRDKTVIARRRGAWFDELICLDGPATPDGPSLAGQVMARREDSAVVHIDVIGWGSSPYDVLVSNGVHAVAVNGAARSRERTADAGVDFFNLRAELWWRMREALDPMNETAIALPPDPALKADLTAPRWKQALAGIQIEAKDEVARRIGRSPDRGDAVCMALMTTPKRVERRPVRRTVRGGGTSWMG